jgi:t-SNARE complex subunit (syntaxin)
MGNVRIVITQPAATEDDAASFVNDVATAYPDASMISGYESDLNATATLSQAAERNRRAAAAPAVPAPPADPAPAEG